jgi:hypothetical protein
VIEGLGAIDWGHPAFAPFAQVGVPIAQAVGQGADLRDALNVHTGAQVIRTSGGHMLRFIPQDALPPATAYEAHIATTGEVPTRDNLHGPSRKTASAPPAARCATTPRCSTRMR